MTYQRLPYEDASSATEMATDCAEVGLALQVPVPRLAPAGHPAADRLVVSEGLAEMAAGLHLHFD
jgi:hypothetical protein